MSDQIGTDAVRRAALTAWEAHLGRPVDRDRLLAELARGALPAAFHATAAVYPRRPALSIEGQSVTHGELDHRAARTAGWLRSRGIGRGDRVLISSPSSVPMIAGYLGALRAGATIVLANPDYTENELHNLIGAGGVSAAFASGPHLTALRAMTARDATLRLVVALDGDASRCGHDGPALEETVASGSALGPDECDNGDTALLAYTSGTTGKPKGAPLTHANLLASIRGVMLAWRWRPDDVLVHCLPLSHQHGLGGVHATLLAGSRAIIHERLDPARLCRTIQDERATVLFAVPSIYERLLAWEGVTAADFSSLRLATSGSAPLSPALARRIAGVLGRLPVERYGSTEAGLDVSNPYDGPCKAGSVGLPLPGIELAIVDASGRAVPAGHDGEIVLRGPQVFGGYAGPAAATATAFHEGGWFRTGDIGLVDPSDGYLRMTGRAKDLIITGGLNVYPREVELALEELPEVERAVVLGVPSSRWGEEVVAFVLPAPGSVVDPAALIAAARLRLAAYKCPKRILTTDAFPLDHVGKVRRGDLARLAVG